MERATGLAVERTRTIPGGVVMTSTSVFFSYARRDAEIAQHVAAQIDDLGLSPWLDRRLSGGQPWWDTILEQIRTCDRFVFILSDASLRSKACRAELDYAHQLGRSILPVETAPVIDQLLPPYLAETQRIPAADLAALARALLALPPARPLPDPLPPPPLVPLSYLDELADAVGRDELSLAEQRNLLGALKQLLRDEDEREAGVALLQRLRHHPTVNAWVAEEVDAELSKIRTAPSAGGDADGVREAPADERPAPPPPPRPPWTPAAMPPAPPAGQRRTHRTGWIIGASVGAVAAIVAGVVIVGALGDDDPPTPDPTTTTSTEPDEGTPDDDVIATLSDECGAGDMQSCDDLYFAAPVDSLDETFGATCGTRTDGGNPGGCTADVGSSADLWDGCDAGDMQSCDDLYFDAPVDSLAEAFGATCGGRTDGSGAGECLAGLGA